MRNPRGGSLWRPREVGHAVNLNENCDSSTLAAAEFGRIAKECHRLALKTLDKNLIAEAKASFAMVAGL
jgi:hypothetical protein